MSQPRINTYFFACYAYKIQIDQNVIKWWQFLTKKVVQVDMWIAGKTFLYRKACWMFTPTNLSKK